MFNLFKAEFRKYRNRAVLLFIAHVALMAFMNVIIVDVNAAPVFQLWLIVNIMASATFGTLQMNGHKRINHWIYLLQRPLAPWKIAAGLMTAGGFLVVLVALTPFVMNLLVAQLSASDVIEQRHYQQLGLIVMAVLTGYAYGCFLGLYTHRFRFIGLAVFLALINSGTGGEPTLALLLLGLMVASCLYLWFKPDLASGATSPLFIVLSELPLHSGLFWIALQLHTLLLTVNWSVTQSGPEFERAPGTEMELVAQEPRAIMLAALDGSMLPNAEFYRQQMRLGEVVIASNGFRNAYPERNQRPSLDSKLSLVDPETNATWRFSHTEMLFKGVDRESDAVLGWLGPQGFVAGLAPELVRFASVPWVSDNRFVLDFQAIYQLDWEHKAWQRKFALDGAPERFLDTLAIHEDFVTVLSDRNLYVLRSTKLSDVAEPLRLEARVPLPAPDFVMARSRVYVMELIDGYMVGILTGAVINFMEGDYVTLDSPGLYLHEAGSGEERLLASRELRTGYSAAHVYRGIVIAPGLRVLNDLVFGLLNGGSDEETLSFLRHRFPPLVLVLVLCSMLGSGYVVKRLLKPVDLPRAAKFAWVGIAAFSGLIGLASFYFGSYRTSLRLQVGMNP